MEKLNSFYFPLEVSEGGGTSAVTSVNSKIGDVVLTGADISDDTLTTIAKNVTGSINELNSNKEIKTNIVSASSTDYYIEETSQYTIELQKDTDIYITDAITGTWNINLPTSAQKGDMASLNFTCSSTAAPTIVINTTFQKEDAIPSEGDKVEINAKYDGTNWVSLMNKISEVTTS